MRPMTYLGLKKMRKSSLLMLLCVLFSFSSCMKTFYATKRTTFEEALTSVQTQMNKDGFKIVGSNSETKNNVYVSAISYSQYTGYGSKMENNFVTQDTYRFADEEGNTMSYSVSYSAKQTNEGVSYIEGIEVCGCETSNPKDYERLCGNESIIKRINSLPKDQEIEQLDVMGTTLAVSGITIGLTLLITMIILGGN